MKIKSITVQGFRGFNEKRTIDFHERLTLIYAPNSYGKTSISEALEWLFYGITSKVEKADSKEEYKGSYRNLHFPESSTPFVKVKLINDGNEIEFCGELTVEENIKRFVDGKEVVTWPLKQDLLTIPKPFILQHALKYLLLVRPDERFHGFARLLGLEELDQIQKNIVSLCTKPDAAIPSEVIQFFNHVNALEARLVSVPSLKEIAKSFKKGAAAVDEIYEVIITECKRRIPYDTPESSILYQLLKIREEAVSKIFKGNVTLFNYSEDEKRQNSDDENFFCNFCVESFIKKYTDLIALEAVQHLFDKVEFFHLGVNFLNKTPQTCPFCGQLIDGKLSQHVHEEYKILSEEKKRSEYLQSQRNEIVDSLAGLCKRLELYQLRHVNKVKGLLVLKPSFSQLETILAQKYSVPFQVFKDAFLQIEAASNNLELSYEKVLDILKKVGNSIIESKEDAELIKKLGEALVEYISDSQSFIKIVSNYVPTMSETDQLLKSELDTLAGTEDITILADLFEGWSYIKKSFKIRQILEGLKELRRLIDQRVASIVLNAISGELTSDVMEWYGLIKTTGDPDVHFDGFDMERTKDGELKARRIKIKAKSYGRDLVSAVSSLSESKLNALGLCVSIAMNLKNPSPFAFLIIDDPIQSWDAEHEIQFINVIRKLVENGKQIVLLSHNHRWLEQVRSGCRSMNGWFYEITSYTEAGPHISEAPWEQWKKRLDEVDAILKDSSASNVKLQQAEEEIRIIISEVTCELYKKSKGEYRSPHYLNSTKVRKMLIECGVETGVVDRITQTFETTDDAHHAQSGYAPQKERLRQYHSWVYELTKLLT